MKLNKIFSIVLGLLLLGMSTSFGQNKPPSQADWKTYEAANGEKFMVNMATIGRSNARVTIWGKISGGDTSMWPKVVNGEQVFIFDCHGHFTFIMDTAGWRPVTSHSVVGQAAKDVCAKL